MCNAVTNDDPEPHSRISLRRTIREALAAGLLPLARLGSVVRRGAGQPCFICNQAIVPSELESEVQLAPRRSVIVHQPCYLLRRVETLSRVATLGHPSPKIVKCLRRDLVA
jgi:hypothetical protein